MLNRPRVIVTHRIHDGVIKYLEGFSDPVLNQTDESLDAADIISLSRHADGIMAFMPDKIDETHLQQCKRLRIIAGAFKGADNVDVCACTRHGVWVTNVPSLLTEPTAELAIGLLISLTRNVIKGNALVKSGNFNGWKPILYGRCIAEMDFGIIGFGSIGQSIADKLKNFNPKGMSYYDNARNADRDAKAEFRELSNLISNSDCIILCIPLTTETIEMISEASIRSMKKGVYIINCGRGSVVNESAIAKALMVGQIAGYASDVYAMEDRGQNGTMSSIDNGIMRPEVNTVLTPHLGSAVQSIRYQIEMQAAINIWQTFNGGRPQDAINELSLLESNAFPAKLLQDNGNSNSFKEFNII